MSIEMEKTSQLAAVVAMPTLHLPRVNLMPQEVAAESKLRSTQLILGGVTVAVAAGIAGVAVLCFMGVSKAQDGLETSQARTTTLQQEEAKYAAVPKTLSEIDTLKNAQAQAMATDVAWYQQLDVVNQAFPTNMKFKSLTVSLNADGAAAAAANPLATPNTIGSLTVEGYGPNFLNTADWMDALVGKDGFVDPYYSQATLAAADDSTSTIVQVSSTVSLTSDVLTHRFDRKAD